MTCGSILLVDDDRDIRLTIGSVLEDSGYKVYQAGNGLEALEVLRKLSEENLPGMIILDLQMPVMDGGTFLEKLPNESSAIQKIPVVVFSAKGSISAFGELANAREKMKKPMDLDDLYDVVERHCGVPN